MNDSYVQNKIAHMIRQGILTISSNFMGRGQNGGACPNWLHERQQAEHKRINAQRLLSRRTYSA